MNTRIRLSFGAFLCLTALATSSGQEKDTKPTKGLEGYWQATLKSGGGTIEVRMILKFTKEKGGKLTGTLDIPDTGATGAAVDEISLKDSNVRLEIRAKKVVFEGKLNQEQTELSGTLKQGGAGIPLTFKRLSQAPKPRNRPQTPKKPYPYDEEEVIYENKKDGVKLAGTLTLPRSKGPFPVVLLITGSGQQDRDETILEHKPFLLLADYLTRRGVAVLRVDDRGAGKSTGDFAKSTTEDFAGDVLAGVEFLKGRKDINPKQIGLMGHSEGGIIAPMLASRSKDIAFIVMLAGSGFPGEDILVQQSQAILKAMGVPAKQLEAARRGQQDMLDVIKREKDDAAALKALRDPLVAAIAKLEGEARKAAQKQLEAAEPEFQKLVSPWYRFFLVYDPRPALKKVQCPVLVLNGEKDLQVLAKENLAEIEKALKAGGNKDYTIKELPTLNHLFQTCKTGLPQEYGQIEETVAPAALEIIGDWIVTHTLKSPAKK
jgi:pimeloyl-ACP methyl ester carboxylesterase